MFEFLFGKKKEAPKSKKESAKKPVSETGWKPTRKEYAQEGEVDSAAYSKAYQKWLNSRGEERSIRPPNPRDFLVSREKGGSGSEEEEEIYSAGEIPEEPEEKEEMSLSDYDVDAFIEANNVWLKNMEPGKQPRLEDFPIKHKSKEVDVDAYRKSYVRWLRNPASGPRPKAEDFPKKRS